MNVINISLNDDLENECPICFDKMIIYVVCKNNHKLCNSCYHKMLKQHKCINCPLCRIVMTPKSSSKALLRSVLNEKELSNKSLYEKYHKAFYTGYNIMSKYNKKIKLLHIKALRDIVYSLFEDCEDNKNIILNSLKFELPIFLVEQFFNKYNIQYQDIYQIIIESIMNGNKKTYIIFLIKKFPHITFDDVYLFEYMEKKNFLQFTIESNCEFEILKCILDINPELILVKDNKGLLPHSLAKEYGYQDKYIKKIKKLHYKQYRFHFLNDRIEKIKNNLYLFKEKYL